jgi:pyruvate dehydrogenase E1 component alpha subunit
MEIMSSEDFSNPTTFSALDSCLLNSGLKTNLLSNNLRSYLCIYFIRKVEEKIVQKYPDGKIRTPVHLCIGQEAVPVGISSHLRLEDKVLSGHRSHGHYLAKGGSLTKLFAEILGKESGCAKGRGGSQHLIDLEANFIASAPILGGTMPIAAGVALNNRIKEIQGIVVSYVGDAVLEEGVFYETLSFSSLHKLPILFVVENNNLSVHTFISERQPKRNFTDLGLAFGLDARACDGNQVDKVAENAQVLISRIRNERLPSILFCDTYRQLEHVGPNDDIHLGYRSIEQHQKWLQKDPLNDSEAKLSRIDLKAISKSDFLSHIDAYIENCWSLASVSEDAK